MSCTQDNLTFFSLYQKKIAKLFFNKEKLKKNKLEINKNGKSFCPICKKTNKHIISATKYTQCNYLIHQKCKKSFESFENFICSECNSENFLFFEINNNDLLENYFNSNFSCKCHTNRNMTINPEKDVKLLNLKELNFQKDSHYAQLDPDEHIDDPTEFKYYTTHEFHKLNANISSRGADFSLFYSNICSLNGNKEKLQDLINNLDNQFDVIALTETWHTKNNIYFDSGQIEGYHKYEGTEGSSNKGG